MNKIEQAKQYFCDLCSVKNETDKIVGGKFCVKLSGIPGNREEFKLDLFSPNGGIQFWSSQCMGDIEDCKGLQKARKEQNTIPEAIE